MDVVNLKISKLGGLTKARLIRDLCVALGIRMTIEDTWGGDIVTATIAHLARSTPAEFLLHERPISTATSRVSIAEGAPQARRRLHDRVATRRGLGSRRRSRASDRRCSRSPPELEERHAPSKSVHIVACHAEGEVGDVIVGGVLRRRATRSGRSRASSRGTRRCATSSSTSRAAASSAHQSAGAAPRIRAR